MRARPRCGREVGAREGGEEGAETVHTLVSENEARARWERLQSFLTTFTHTEWGTHSTENSR
eukprot:4258092-Prymnesium_polylepis.1